MVINAAYRPSMCRRNGNWGVAPLESDTIGKARSTHRFRLAPPCKALNSQLCIFHKL